MKKLNFLLILISSLLYTTSCDNDTARVDDDLVPYFEAFEQEAAKRGVVFDNDVEAIDGYLQNIVAGGADLLGACRPATNADERRSIFIDEPFWDDASALEREYVVFHELGHCFLGRDHFDSQDSLGNCTSMMAAGSAGCNGITVYSNENREVLLDELFR